MKYNDPILSTGKGSEMFESRVSYLDFRFGYARRCDYEYVQAMRSSRVWSRKRYCNIVSFEAVFYLV